MPSVSMLRDAGGEAPGDGVRSASGRELDAVLAELAHALANSLNSIAAASELAELLIARDELAGARKSLTRIESECMRAARLLRDGRKFLTFEVGATGDSVDIVALIRVCADPFADRVDIDAGRSLPEVCGDAGALRRMFEEILANAFESGATRVRVGVRQETSTDELRIDFRDDGPGISAPVARIFTPFFSTRPDRHSGLGLALAARIATAHGGSIGADDAEPNGAFWIKLPVREA